MSAPGVRAMDHHSRGVRNPDTFQTASYELIAARQSVMVEWLDVGRTYDRLTLESMLSRYDDLTTRESRRIFVDGRLDMQNRGDLNAEALKTQMRLFLQTIELPTRR
jgi:hypothetical protein